MTVHPDEILAVFQALHEEVRAMLAAGRPPVANDAPTTFNAKGDEQAWFDLEAHRLSVARLRERIGTGWLLSEEHDEPIWLGADAEIPENVGGLTIVIDPVDGSTNAKRGISPSAFAAVAFAEGEPLEPSRALVSLIGPLQPGHAVAAIAGEGAFRVLEDDRETIRCAPDRPLAKAFVSVEHPEHLARPGSRANTAADPPVLSAFGSIRSIGSAASALAMVATGVFHAHIDVRGTLTPENYLAAGHVILEAGGTIVGADGNPLKPVRALTEGRAVVAAASGETAAAIIDRL